GRWKTASIPVQVNGVGFFDYRHGQVGMALNGLELHPVLGITFDARPTPANSDQDLAQSLAVQPADLPPAAGFDGEVFLPSSGEQAAESTLYPCLKTPDPHGLSHTASEVSPNYSSRKAFPQMGETSVGSAVE